MARIYHLSHKVKKLEINFNQKQWRQDFAYFIKQKLMWNCETIVTKTKLDDFNVKYFEIKNSNNEIVYVKFHKKNEILSSTFLDLAKEYLVSREM